MVRKPEVDMGNSFKKLRQGLEEALAHKERKITLKSEMIEIPDKNVIQYCECLEKTNIVYDEKYDSYYCSECWKWVEKICSDEKCQFCSNRPKRPLKSENIKL
jgi:hypothetical protein